MSKMRQKWTGSPPAKRRETSPTVLRKAMLRRLLRRLSTRAEVSLAPVPALLEHYVRMFNTIWSALGRVYTDEELGRLRDVLRRLLVEAYDASPYSSVVVSYNTLPAPNVSLGWQARVNISTAESEYEHWIKTRKPPLFGKHPDAKVMALAQSLGEPSAVTVLDVGAGTGRNTLPLARAGFLTDGVELVPALATILREEIAKENLPVRVYEGDACDPRLDLPIGHYRAVVLAEVASHFRDVAQLNRLFTSLAKTMVPGGLLLFSVFLASDGYQPDHLALQLSQVMWSTLFTRKDISSAMEGLPFELVSDEGALEYEKIRLPPDQWPPTGWYEGWAGGRDLFELPPDRSPMELRWLVYRKS